ncbi:MAG: hypothetical protein V4805_06500 [Pseudomonadota bacterium]
MPWHRQSALLLHGIQKRDQSWILARLAEEDQHIVRKHLAELHSLGIPVDPTLIDAATSGASAPTFIAPLQQGGLTDLVARASAVHMHALLADEPVWLVRHVLALDQWSWQQDFLATLTPGQRERLSVTGATPIVVGSKLGERLHVQLSLRLAEFDLDRAAARSSKTPGGLLSFLQQAVRRWL